MKKSLRIFLAFGVLLGSLLLTKKVNAQQSLTQINNWNAYVHLPASYTTSTQTYPTIIFFPGLGEVGTTATKVIQYGPGAYITQGWNGNVSVNGNTVEFIVISLQPSAAFPNEIAINQRIQTIKSLYRVDPDKLFLTGLSHGGWCSSTFVTGDPMSGPYTYASQIAAVVTVQGMKPDDNQPYPALFDNFALNGGKYLGFEQINDGRDTRTVVDRMNATVPNSGIYVQTNFGGGGHCCWSQFYGGGGVQPQNFMLDGINQNIYQWLARQALGGTNQLPEANAGPDQEITLPVDFTQLNGSATDADGTVMSYLWRQLSGPSVADIFNVASPVTLISTLVPGQYEFELYITDNSGGADRDTVVIQVNPPLVSACNPLPPVTYTLTPTGNEIYYPDASSQPWKGGDTLKIPAGNYTLIELSNFTGDSCRKIVIVNSGGKVTAANIRFRNNARFFRFSGTGTPGIEYGFKVNGGMLAATLCHDFEIDHVEATGGNIGMYIKTTPDETIPNSVYIPGSTSNYVMKNIYVHHNWIHHIAGEGFYIGHTGPSGGQNGNGSNGQPLIPLRLDNVEIAYNLVEEIDWDGIQLSNARNNARIHHNTVRNFGRINMSSQQAGIIMGGNTNGDIYNNTVETGSGNGIQIFGYGTINVYNNVIDSTGYDQTSLGQESVLANDIITGPETNPRQQINFYNNTVNYPMPKGAVRVGAYYSNSLAANVSNNLYCIPGAPSNWLSTYVAANPTGSIVNNNTLYCSVLPNVPPTANAGNDITITLPVNSVSLSGTGSDQDGTITIYQWIKIAGPSAGTITSPSSANTTVTGLVQGVYKFELRVTDNNSAIGRDTMQVTVNPAPNQSPSANAGNDISITLPVNSTALIGTGTDPDGTISAYQWTKISGPASGAINNATSANANAVSLVQGIYKFELRVTDNSGAVDRDTMQVTVNPAPNQAPSANAGNDISVTLPINAVTLNGSGTDPDGSITSYQWTKISGPASGTINNPLSAVTGVSSLVEGSYNFELRVTDNAGASGRDTVHVTVNAAAIPPPNQAPSANAGSDVTITLPVNTAVLSGTGNDPDGTITAYQWTKISGPASGTVSNATSANASAVSLVQGIYKFELLVTDNNGATGRDTMQVTVNAAIPPPNQAPSANAGSDVTITLPVNTAVLSGTGNDPDGTITAYQWTKISGPATGTVSNATSANASAVSLVQGIYKFELLVTDNNGATGRDTMQVTVNAAIPPPNQAPSANAGSDVTITLPVNTAALSGTGNDPDGTITAYQWTKISGPATGTVSNATSANASAVSLVQGIYKFELLVTDNNGASDRDTMQVTVLPVPNQGPSANAGVDQNLMLPNNTATLTGTGNDPDGTIVAYQWTKVAGPATGSITTSTSANTTVTGLIQGIYKFELRVTDNSGATARDTMQITVNPAPPNQGPTANAGLDQNLMLPNNTATLTGTGNDPDGSITAYLWTKIAGPASGVIANQNSAITTVNNLVQGTYKFELTVTDNSGASAKDTMQIIVNAAPPPPNQLPVVNAGLDMNIMLPNNSVVLSGSANDPDGTITSLQWTKISGPVATITNVNALSTQVTGMVQGIYNFELRVTDNNGAIARDTVRITVNAAPNQPPTAHAGSDVEVYLPVNTTELHGSGSDPDGNPITYQWAIISGPQQFQLENATNPLAQLNNMSQGIYLAELTVTDIHGAYARDTVTISVGSSRIEGKADVARVYPNPVINKLTVEINTADINRKVALIVTDVRGAVLLKKEIMITEYVQLERIDMSGYAKGNYYLGIHSDEKKPIAVKILKL